MMWHDIERCSSSFNMLSFFEVLPQLPDEEFQNDLESNPIYQDHELLDYDMRDKHYKRIVNNYI